MGRTGLRRRVPVRVAVMARVLRQSVVAALITFAVTALLVVTR